MHVSIVIPARNEALNIAAAVAAVHHILGQGGWLHDIIVVDDRSEDNTRGVAEALAARYPLSVVANDAGPGKGGALRTGFRHARGDIVGFIDADLEFPAAALAELLRAVLGSRDPFRTAAVGVRREDARTSFERLTSTMAHWVIRRALAVPVRDTQAGVKVFPGWFAREVLTQAGESSWLFDAEAVLLAQRESLQVAQVPVAQDRRRPRRAGITGLIRGTGDVLRIAWRYRVRRREPILVVPSRARA